MSFAVSWVWHPTSDCYWCSFDCLGWCPRCGWCLTESGAPCYVSLKCPELKCFSCFPLFHFCLFGLTGWVWVSLRLVQIATHQRGITFASEHCYCYFQFLQDPQISAFQWLLSAHSLVSGLDLNCSCQWALWCFNWPDSPHYSSRWRPLGFCRQN